MKHRTLVGFLLLASTSLGTAHADWPLFAHDPQRTALAIGTSQITKPVPRWRSYLGGGISHAGMMGADLDGNGTSDLLIVSGGRVLARRADDYQLWNSPLINAQSLVDILDLDGDGQQDIVVLTADRLVVLAAKTGNIEWQSVGNPGGSYPLGPVGAVRIADLDGDGFLDLLATALLCGSVGNADERTGVAFSFHGGGTLAAPKLLLEQKNPARDYLCGANDSLADIDGDGILEWIALGDRHLYAYATRDDLGKGIHAGDLKLESNDLGFLPWGQASVSVGDVDADGKADLVLFTNGNSSAANNSRRVQIVGQKTVGATTTLSQKWVVGVADLVSDSHAFSSNSLVDLDGDGKLDVVTSFLVAGVWTLRVYDGATGMLKASVPNNALQNVVDLDGQKHYAVFATDTSSKRHLYVWQAGALIDTIVIPDNVNFVRALDRSVARLQSLADRLITMNACGDARPELVALEDDGNSKAVILSAFQTSAAASPSRCTNVFDLTARMETLLDAFPLPDGTLTGARSSGFMSKLLPQEGLVDSLAGGEFTSPGVRLGGYYSGAYAHNGFPIAVKMGLTTPVLAIDSRGFLLSLDASSASLLTPPKSNWSLPNVFAPTGFDVANDATPEILAWNGGNVTVLDATNGTTLKSFPVLTANNTYGSGDILATDIDGDSHPDLLYQITNAGTGKTETYALDYGTGAQKWSAPYIGTSAGCWVPSLSFAPVASGPPELITSNCEKAVELAAATGAMKVQSNTLWGSFLVSFDSDSDGTPELFSSGTRGQTARFDHALNATWTLQSTLPAGHHYAAVAHCADGSARYAGTREDLPLFFILDAATGVQKNGTVTQPGVVLAGGAAYDSVDKAVTAGKVPGTLGNVTAAANLHGANTPTFLVGSTDGYLYAFDACTGALSWALNLRWAVGQPILADVRNNGREEIVVSVGDGYLYGIDQEVFPAPASVRDVDPIGGHPNDQVSDIDTLDSLYVAWAPVPGAISYQCAVIDPGGTIITPNADFVDCGSGSTATIHALALHDGALYVQAVRAVGAPGASIETFSSGVTVHLRAPMVSDAGVGDASGDQPPDKEGCSCQVGGHTRPIPLFAVLLLLALVAVRARYVR